MYLGTYKILRRLEMGDIQLFKKDYIMAVWSFFKNSL